MRRAPRGALPLKGARCGDGVSFEASLSALVTRVFWPLGLHVEALSRVPYLCRGDSRRPYYVLSDAILVLRPTVQLSPAAPREGDVRAEDAVFGSAPFGSIESIIRANLRDGGQLSPVGPPDQLLLRGGRDGSSGGATPGESAHAVVELDRAGERVLVEAARTAPRYSPASRAASLHR